MKKEQSSTNSLHPRTSDLAALEQRGYIIGNKIGQGSYATVHIADYYDPKTQNRQRLACKIFDQIRAPQDFLHKFFPRELEILTTLEHPYVIQVHSILQRGPRVFIFMRHAENGDLLNFIKRNGAVAESIAREWFRQMATGLQYLHNKQIAHRDLKCENVLLSKINNIKLADFGFATYCVNQDGNRILSQTYCGSAAYAAPEVVSGTPYNPKLADIWSLGVILYIMLNASMPFNDANLRKLLQDQLRKNWVFNTKLQDTLSEGAKMIIERILEPDLTVRYNLDMILSYYWLNQRQSEHSSSTITSTPTMVHDEAVHRSSPVRRSIAGNAQP